MSNTPVAGTFRLDGMLQGSLPPDADTVADFESWVSSAKAAGLIFHLRIEGGNYSLVVDGVVRKISSIKSGDVESIVVDSLQALLDLLPPEMRSRSFSTIRSEEFRPGKAVQSIYTIGRDGMVKSEQRDVEIETAEPEPEITPASLRAALLPALLMITLTLFISTFFIDYRRLFTDARDRIVPLKKEELTVSQELAENFVTIQLVEVDRKNSVLILSLERGSRWQSAMELKPAEAMELGWKEFNTLDALRKGRCRVTQLDKNGKCIATREIDVRGLQEEELILVSVLANSDERIASVVLSW